MPAYPAFALAFRRDAMTPAAKIIARVAGHPVHVAVLFGDTCIEAVEGVGVRELRTDDRLREGEWTIVPVPSFGSPDAAYQFARSELGAPYDWKGVLWAWMAGRVGGNGSRTKWFCSEFAAQALMESGVELSIRRAAYYTPARLYRTVSGWYTT